MTSTVSDDAVRDGAADVETFPVVYNDPLPAAQTTSPGQQERRPKKVGGLTPPRTLPTKGIFSSLSTTKILEQSPSVPAGKPEIQPGTWGDAVPDDFYSPSAQTRSGATDLLAPPTARPSPPEGKVEKVREAASVPERVPSAPAAPSVTYVAAEAGRTSRSPSPPQRQGAPIASVTTPARAVASVATPSPLSAAHSPSKPRAAASTGRALSLSATGDTPHPLAATPVKPDAATSEADEERRHMPSPLRSTAASRRRSLSVQAELAELRQRTPSPERMAFSRPVGFFGEPPLVEKREASPPTSYSADEVRPKGFDKYEDEGRRKREALAAREAEAARRASQPFTFTPAISAVAKRRKTAETFDDFLADQAQKQHETEERHRRMSQAVLAQEEERRKSAFVNEHSQRLLAKRARRQAAAAGDGAREGSSSADGEGTAAPTSPSRRGGRQTEPRLSIVDRLDEVVAMQRENRERLVRENQPTFQPQLATRTASAHKSKSGAGGEPTLLLTDGQHTDDKSGGGDADHAEKKDKYAYFVSLYERTVAQKEATRAKLDRIKEREAEEAAPKEQKQLTAAEAEALVAAIERREAERKLRWEKKLQLAEQEEAEALHKPKLSAKTEKLAQRAKSRWSLAEQRRQAALEEERRKAAARPLHVKTADARSPAFEQHQTESLDRRSRRIAQLREQKLAEEMRECTFRPRLSPETERIAEHFSVEPTILELEPHEPDAMFIVDSGAPADAELGIGRAVRSSSRRQSPMKEDPRLSSHDGISPMFDPNRRRLLHEIHEDPEEVTMQSPAPRVPTTSGGLHDASLLTAQAPPARTTFSMESDASLQSHIQSLEEVLGEWQSLERELSAGTPPPRSAASWSP